MDPGIYWTYASWRETAVAATSNLREGGRGGRCQGWNDGSWKLCVYDTFVHLVIHPIGVRRVQSVPGDLSLLRPSEDEDDTAVAEQKV